MAARMEININGTDKIAALMEKRRSDRVSLNVRFDVFGLDVFGKDFRETAITERVSRHGASIVLARALAPEQVVTLRRRSPSFEAEARIIGQVGICPTGHIYGIALLRAVDFWGIRFAPLTPAEDSLVRLVLCCCSCSLQEVVDVSEVEISVLQANDRLVRPCVSCRQSTPWSHGSSSRPPLFAGTGNPAGRLLATAQPVAESVPGTYARQRKYGRVKVSLLTCIQQPGAEELVRAVDISRGGVRFQSSREYMRNAWIQVAVPFAPAGANIFIPGRIIWGAVFSGDTAAHYGVKYVVPSY